MAASKYKRSLKKKLNSDLDKVVGSLRKENAYLKKALAELSHLHYKLVEKFLTLETKRLESCQQPTTEDEKTALPSEQLGNKEENPMDVVSTRRRSMSSYAKEIEEIKNKLATVSTRCQYLESRVAGKQDTTADEQASTSYGAVTELQNQLTHALEKNKQWLEYDQQREAYVKAILARMLWLEKQLNEANQACSQQHNEDHSDEKEKKSQMQEHYERVLQKTKDELEVLKEQVDVTNQNLIIAKNWEKDLEVEELRQQLQTERMSSTSAQKDHHNSEDEEEQLSNDTKDLQGRLAEEKRKSANFELQGNLFQRFMLNRHHEDQEKIADLERQIQISSQDLEDHRQDCSYLKKQMVRVLKMLRKKKDPVTKQSKEDQQDHSSHEVTHPPAQFSRDSPASSPHSSLLNESFLECPSCQAEYPASHYRELMNHLEVCLE